MDYIDFSQPTFYYVLANIFFNPLFWNTVARAEYRSHILTKLAGGNRYLGCYVLAVTIFSIGIIRDYLYTWALDNQPTHPALESPLVQLAAVVLFAVGGTLVLTSMRASPAGILLTLVVYIVYQIALMFEGPFTTMIYENKAKNEKKAQ
ncbi:phospholipid methyltransferase [Lichtheimia corymbifera JMRC:FSU:9682]|uniref:Phospholipid methyltransferase n=1 Tax=Lichtheimia corymbifera JMRC:FSU:9682 TaxID=1263082 RepID=A0A068RKL6_9FUNG|nr:phospholipid methyltransferase [Lichtheimia corymbifera JMRC:FSU:9682]